MVARDANESRRPQPHLPQPNLPQQSSVGRRKFMQATAGGAAATFLATRLPNIVTAAEAPVAAVPESVVKKLYGTLSEAQRKAICFDWDYIDPSRGLLRTRVSANWNITDKTINSEFFTDEQRDMLREMFLGMIHPDWHARYDQQLDDDCGGFGEGQSIAIFGDPTAGKFELVLSGRHMTLRCDGNSADHVAFGGPIFYGHAPEQTEFKEHPGNVFWHQAVAANQVYEMLDGKQRDVALVANRPGESRVAFQGAEGKFPGIAIADLSADQKSHAQQVLEKLIEPFRQSDQDEVVACLKAQGGLDKCHLAFYSDGDLGEDKVWDNWRLEGPSFVWYFRGSPHVHVWVNIADSSQVELNA
ncbi:MAG: DUF3500 domain-containing protein [Planctomycetales bacterium]|nr:DUF3500 domain-containing protein [Planctomycetales bacterium]